MQQGGADMDTIHFNGREFEPLEVLGALANHYGLHPDDYSGIFYQAYANHHTRVEADEPEGRAAIEKALKAWTTSSELPYWLLADHHYKVAAA